MGRPPLQIHQALKDKDRLPKIHIVDTGYLDTALLVSSQKDFGVDLLGPTRPDLHWQAKAGQGFDVSHFQINWEKQQAICPEGQISHSWTPAVDKRVNEGIKIKFASKVCRRCPSREQCFRSQKKYPHRTITVRTQKQHQVEQVDTKPVL